MRKIFAFVLFVGALLLVGGFKASLSSERPAVVIPTPLTKNVGDYYVSIGVFSIAELEKNFPRAYKLLVKHHGKPSKNHTHAELEKNFPRAYKLLVKHHGKPSKNHTHHLAVSIWKEEKGKEVFLSDYKVEAEVRSA